MDDVFGSAAFANDEVFFVGSSANTRKIRNRLAKTQGGVGTALLVEDVRHALFGRSKVFFFACLHRVWADEDIAVDRADEPAAFGVLFLRAGSPKRGDDGVEPDGGFAVQNRIRASARMNRKEAVAGHFGNIFRKNACRVDDDLGVNRSTVCLNTLDLAVFHAHTENCGIEREPNTVIDRVFRVGNGQSVRRNDPCGGEEERAVNFRVHMRLTAVECLFAYVTS
ncbi:hypothetical protein SDC9_100581 [bioreactor metagenome]|uniref:Uncharacterized protein n=1 Tax=bioreactor metagenome TaxID=1076179 RepID=A0A645AKR0_9ZZZZ